MNFLFESVFSGAQRGVKGVDFWGALFKISLMPPSDKKSHREWLVAALNKDEVNIVPEQNVYFAYVYCMLQEPHHKQQQLHFDAFIIFLRNSDLNLMTFVT